MSDTSRTGRALAEWVRAGAARSLDAVVATDATLVLGEDTRGGLAAFLPAIGALDDAQRAGVVVLGDADRSVVVAPPMPGAPSSRLVLVATHPGDGEIIELLGYDDVHADQGGRHGEYPSAVPPPIPIPRSTVPPVAPADDRVLVTASSEGLGRSIGEAFLAAGAAVVFHGRRSAVDLPEGDAGRAGYVAGDLADPRVVGRVSVEASRLLGGPATVLVHALGPWDPTPVSVASADAWHRAMDANVHSAVELTRLIAPGMRLTGRGRIVFVSAGSAWLRDHGLYGLAKAMLAPLVETLAVELAPEITVNVIAPGQILESVATMESLEPGAAARMLRATPAGRLATREEVARAIVALTRGPFDMVTGAVVPFDGGARLATERRFF